MDVNIFVVCLLAALFSVFGIAALKKGSTEENTDRTELAKMVLIKDMGTIKRLWRVMMILLDFAAAIRLSLGGESVLSTARALALLTVLWVCAWWDFNFYLIPNKVLLAALAARVVLFGAEALTQPEGLKEILLTCAGAGIAMLVTGVLCRLISSDSLGFGDVKLMAVLGLFLGLERTWSAMLYSMLVIFLACLLLLLTKKAKKDSSVPFAPAMLMGTWLSLVL